jgi:hypothetical protein
VPRLGLQYNENATAPGAQTERRCEAGPVRDLLGGWTSPASCWLHQINRSRSVASRLGSINQCRIRAENAPRDDGFF